MSLNKPSCLNWLPQSQKKEVEPISCNLIRRDAVNTQGFLKKKKSIGESFCFKGWSLLTCGTQAEEFDLLEKCAFLTCNLRWPLKFNCMVK